MNGVNETLIFDWKWRMEGNGQKERNGMERKGWYKEQNIVKCISSSQSGWMGAIIVVLRKATQLENDY